MRIIAQQALSSELSARGKYQNPSQTLNSRKVISIKAKVSEIMSKPSPQRSPRLTLNDNRTLKLALRSNLTGAEIKRLAKLKSVADQQNPTMAGISWSSVVIPPTSNRLVRNSPTKIRANRLINGVKRLKKVAIACRRSIIRRLANPISA